MNDISSDRVGPMLNPPHLGELIRESMDDLGWNVTGPPPIGARTQCTCERKSRKREMPADGIHNTARTASHPNASANFRDRVLSRL